MHTESQQQPGSSIRALGDLLQELSPLALELWNDLRTVPPIVKGDGSPVTMADFAIQAVLVSRLREWDSDANFICEESLEGLTSAQRADVDAIFLTSVKRMLGPMSDHAVRELLRTPAVKGNRWWVIDPIDGTAGFVAGSHFSICVACVEDDRATMSAVACPRLSAGAGSEPSLNGPGSTVIAERGKGAWVSRGHQWHRLNVRSAWQQPLRWARSMNRRKQPMKAQPIVDSLGVSVESIPIDSQCKYALLALDRADLALRLPRQGLPEHSWDHLAGALAAQEAGVTVTDICGSPLNASHGALLQGNQGILCAAPELHGRLLELLAPFVLESPST
jgi:3'(2'), 5'-bisphosphate nucleotidase